MGEEVYKHKGASIKNANINPVPRRNVESYNCMYVYNHKHTNVHVSRGNMAGSSGQRTATVGREVYLYKHKESKNANTGL